MQCRRGCVPTYSCVFFFSSRRRHTRYIGDWSSDVCSSDLGPCGTKLRFKSRPVRYGIRTLAPGASPAKPAAGARSEERRVGKECRSRWGRYHTKKKTKESDKQSRVARVLPRLLQSHTGQCN